MNIQDFVIQITNEAVLLVIIVSMPMILVSLFVGLIMAVFSATTQIQEQTLSFVPKMIAVFLSMALLSGWIGSLLIRFTARCLEGMIYITN
jgi:flagellar biosynthesis protein FliQ